ncbi:MAG: CbiX/SirB N-terminal domain-containing protein [Nannocystaceae bacterium]
MAALILLAHGSPDPAWMAPVEEAAATLRALAGDLDPPLVVRTAALEGWTSLDDAVAELEAAGERTITVVAYFLSPGGRHLRRDIPELCAAVRARRPEVTLNLVPGALGVTPEVQEALARAALRLAREADGA